MKNKLSVAILMIICAISFFGCVKQKDNLSELYDVIYVSRNGANMPVHLVGNAESKIFIILLHGGPGGDGMMYRFGSFVNQIEKEFAVAYLDQRGQGMSQGHLSEDLIGIEEMKKDITALIKVIKKKYGENNQFFLLGHSWGGTLGTAYLADPENQELISGWIEVDGAHDMNLMVKSEIRLFEEIGFQQIQAGNSEDFWEETLAEIKEIDSLNFDIDDIFTVNKLAYKAETRLTADSVLSTELGELRDIFTLFRNYVYVRNPITSFITGSFTNYDLTYDHDIFMKDFSDTFKSLRIPTLLIWGKYDLVVPPELGYQALNLIATNEKELIIFEKSGHSPMINEANAFGEAVVSFIHTYK